jgi:hypothetical protein
MSDIRPELYANELQTCIDATVKLAEGVAPEKRFKAIKPGKSHPAWLIGHLAGAMDNNIGVWALGIDRMMPRGWGRKFAPDFVGGAPITENTDDYPAWDDIVEEYKKIGTALADGIRKLTPEEIDGDLRGEVPEPFKEMFGNTEKTIATMIRHDTHHRGQIAMLAALD